MTPPMYFLFDERLRTLLKRSAALGMGLQSAFMD